MAVSLPPRPLVFSSRPLAIRPSRAFKTVTLAHPVNRNANCSGRSFPPYPTLSSSLQLDRRSFKAYSSVAETDPKVTNGNEVNEAHRNAASDNMVNKKGTLPMKTLIQAYKKAILDGDEKSACELEAGICTVENQRNDFSQKYAEISAEIASGKEKLIRLKADFDNFRKRSEQDRVTFTSDIQGDVVESLLPMIDGFEFATKQVGPESEKEKKIVTSYQGIYKQFVEVMRSLNVSVVETVGKRFDPSIHEAVGREESQQFREGFVTQELRRGFVLGGRILRPATVKVSSGPPTSPLATEVPTKEQPVEATVESSEPTVTTSG